MRLSFALVLLFPALAFGQDEAKKATLKWVLAQEDPNGGFYLAPQDPKLDSIPRPSLRATNGAVRAIKYLGGEVPHKDKHAAFVLKCYDPTTGTFAEPGGKADVASTSIGVMVAAELGIPHDKYAKAMDYLKENAKTFEEVRIGAAAVEAWGVKECPFKLDAWHEIATKEVAKTPLPPFKEGGARIIGSLTAFIHRLGLQKESDSKPATIARLLDAGQLPDGGWCKQGETASDIESTYRVMRAYTLLKQTPGGAKKLREFVESHRNKDGGYATKPGDKSSMSGAYYAAIITKWLDELEKK